VAFLVAGDSPLIRRDRRVGCVAQSRDEFRHLDFQERQTGTILVDGKTLYTLKPNATPAPRVPQNLIRSSCDWRDQGHGRYRVSAAKLGTLKIAGVFK